MYINTTYKPGDWVYIMQDNEPQLLEIISIEILLSLDNDKKICSGVKYHLSNGRFGAISDGSNMFETKRELAEFLFGKF